MARMLWGTQVVVLTVLIVILVIIFVFMPDFIMVPLSVAFDLGAAPTIIGGNRSDPINWPATFVAGDCTSVAVGPHVILTAAHCVNENGEGWLKIKKGEYAKLKCTVHSSFQRNDSAPPEDEGARLAWERQVSPDFALCDAIDTKIKVDIYEIVNIRSGPLSKSILLTGFGCNREQALYEGEATIVRPPVPGSYYTITLGGAAVCFGDSGGGAFVGLADGRRMLVGINSRKGRTSKESLVSMTGLEGFEDFALEWSRDHKRKICGLHQGLIGCGPRTKKGGSP